MSISSAIYAGQVLHVRKRPKQHKLSYSVFSLLIDLDELDQLDRSLRLFGHNRRAIYSVHDADHGDGVPGGLRAWIGARLQEAGINPAGMTIRMLCYPRIFGYVFNPLTVYFCQTSEGEMKAMLYEVSNTFHERHTYVIPVDSGEPVLRHQCAKEMYVSPFMPMNCRYDFRIKPPAEAIDIHIGESDEAGPLLFARFSGNRIVLSDRSLFWMLVTYPLMTLKVTAGIHWEAFKLWGKGVPLHRHKPASEPIASTIVMQNGMSKP
ncbi:DUF1365 domain-containing protein [Rhizobium sp. G187]|uniref:DUF1365 domain-containing protein n=1 Tax=Rhizobium sp. G187 TaxID=3451352 RepID=UPI003EE4A64F